jgi:hypothetical protein
MRSVVPSSSGSGGPRGVKYLCYCYNVTLDNDPFGSDMLGLNAMWLCDCHILIITVLII